MRYLEKRGSMNDRIDIALNKFRSRVNSFPPGLCPLALYRSILQMSINQSCGKCVPCRDVPLDACVLYTTGRIAAEIAEKTAAAGVCVLASRALPTAEAAALAKKTGLTLIGRAWEDPFEIYTK